MVTSRTQIYSHKYDIQKHANPPFILPASIIAKEIDTSPATVTGNVHVYIYSTYLLSQHTFLLAIANSFHHTGGSRNKFQLIQHFSRNIKKQSKMCPEH